MLITNCCQTNNHKSSQLQMTNLSSHSFCGSGLWERLHGTVLARGLPRSRTKCGAGPRPLKTWPELGALPPSSLMWLLVGPERLTRRPPQHPHRGAGGRDLQDRSCEAWLTDLPVPSLHQLHLGVLPTPEGGGPGTCLKAPPAAPLTRPDTHTGHQRTSATLGAQTPAGFRGRGTSARTPLQPARERPGVREPRECLATHTEERSVQNREPGQPRTSRCGGRWTAVSLPHLSPDRGKEERLPGRGAGLPSQLGPESEQWAPRPHLEHQAGGRLPPKAEVQAAGRGVGWGRGLERHLPALQGVLGAGGFSPPHPSGRGVGVDPGVL